MNTRFISLAIIFFISIFSAQGQILYPDTSIRVMSNGAYLDNPWVGGFNAPHFSEIDLNQDGIMDLFAFDREGDRITLYVNEGTTGKSSYKIAHNYRDRFPEIHDWALLLDYNCDGKNDIISYSYGGGMEVYKNTSTPSKGLEFELEYSLIYSYYGVNLINLYVSPVNQPVLVDIDGDTDLDVVTFTLGGSNLEYHKNSAMEDYGRCDTMIFTLQAGCWGNFGMSAFSNTAQLGISCRTSQFEIKNEPQNNSRHSGSCLLGLDIDLDNDYDLINGDILGNNLLLLVNGGDNLNANITSQDSIFPSYDVPVDLASFPAAYYLDLNNDNAKDLIIAPCTETISKNIDNILFYKNTAGALAPVFELSNDKFLSEDMIEVGTGANVELYDVNKDGLTDMLIGNFGYYSPTPPYISGISYYQNVGTTKVPEFNLVTQDFANLNALNLNGIHPCFGDVDGDGDDDMIIGDADGLVHYFNNTAGAGNPVNFVLTEPNYFGIDVGQFSAPYLFDINNDSKLDLIIGERAGNLNYYENIGTQTAADFTLITDSLGYVNVKIWWDNEGYSDPIFYTNGSGNTELLIGSKRGSVFLYNNITGNVNGNFALVDSVFAGVSEKSRASISRADIDNDGIYDILVGNNAGGVVFYSSTTVGIEDSPKINAFSIYPNPAKNIVNIQINENSNSKYNNIQVYSVTGQLVHGSSFNTYKTQLNTSDWPTGVYFIKVETELGAPMVQKLIVH